MTFSMHWLEEETVAPLLVLACLFQCSWTVLSFFSQGHNIFANLCSKEYSNMMQLLKQAILSTDLTLHFE